MDIWRNQTQLSSEAVTAPYSAAGVIAQTQIHHPQSVLLDDNAH
jgi:hypothetical protein